MPRSRNLDAFLHVIREGETNQTADAYRMLNGGGRFDSFDDHPYAGQSAPPGKAAGAYQFIPHTWQDVCARLIGPGPFTPERQDEGAAALCIDKGAGPAIEAGNLKEAIRVLGRTWISLPGLGLERATRVFNQFGGAIPDGVRYPETTPAPAPIQTPKGEKMGAIALPLLAQLLPQIFSLFSGRAQAAITKATGADPAASGQFMQSLISKIGTAVGVPVTDDASAVQAVAAVHTLPEEKKAEIVAGLESYSLEQLAPVLDKLHGYSRDEWSASEASVASARAANAQFTTPEQLLTNPAVVFGFIILGLVAFVVASVLWKDAIIAIIGAAFKLDNLLKEVPGFSTDMQAFVIGAIVGSALTAVIQYVYGSNRQSAAKDVAIKNLSEK